MAQFRQELNRVHALVVLLLVCCKMTKNKLTYPHELGEWPGHRCAEASHLENKEKQVKLRLLEEFLYLRKKFKHEFYMVSFSCFFVPSHRFQEGGLLCAGRKSPC